MIDLVLVHPWTVLGVSLLAGVIGAFIGSEATDGRPIHWFTVSMLYCWGTFIIAAMLFVGAVIVGGATCVSSGGEGAKVWSGCSVPITRWNVILADWQDAIGAMLGLFGVAWSTYYKAMHSPAEVKVN